MSAFPFARDMKVCDSKGAIQTTLLADNYSVSKAACRFDACSPGQLGAVVHFLSCRVSLTAYCRMVPPCLYSLVPFV